MCYQLLPVAPTHGKSIFTKSRDARTEPYICQCKSRLQFQLCSCCQDERWNMSGWERIGDRYDCTPSMRRRIGQVGAAIRMVCVCDRSAHSAACDTSPSYTTLQATGHNYIVFCDWKYQQRVGRGTCFRLCLADDAMLTSSRRVTTSPSSQRDLYAPARPDDRVIKF